MEFNTGISAQAGPVWGDDRNDAAFARAGGLRSGLAARGECLRDSLTTRDATLSRSDPRQVCF